MYQPVLTKNEYDLLDIDDEGYISLFDESDTKDDLNIKNCIANIGPTIQEKFEDGEALILTVLAWGDEEAVISFKVAQD